MLVAWRDDGFWTLLWRRILWTFKLWPRGLMPPRGFVGQASSLFQATDLSNSKRKRIRLTRLASTGDAPRWRLTFVLVTSLHPQRPLASGLSSERFGRTSAGSGVGISQRSSPTSITST